MKKYRAKDNKFYYNLDEKELEKIKEIEELTLTDYERIDNSIPVEKLVTMLEDMLYVYHCKDEELSDLQYHYDNYEQEKKERVYGYDI